MSHPSTGPHEAAQGGAGSVPLSIALQDGFTGEEVVVRVDGDEVARTEARTAWEISFATSFDVAVPSGYHTIELEIPHRGIRSEHTVEARGPLWVGISVDDAAAVWRDSLEPFGYL